MSAYSVVLSTILVKSQQYTIFKKPDPEGVNLFQDKAQDYATSDRRGSMSRQCHENVTRMTRAKTSRTLAEDLPKNDKRMAEDEAEKGEGIAQKE